MILGLDPFDDACLTWCREFKIRPVKCLRAKPMPCRIEN